MKIIWPYLGRLSPLIATAVIILTVLMIFAPQIRPTNLAPSTEPVGCILTPTPELIAQTPTATPNNSQVQTSKPAVVSPSVTPLPFSKTTDLAPDLPAKDKTQVIVYRCNGTYELFYISDVPVAQAVNLQPGDVIVNIISPESLMGHVAPPATSGEPATDTTTLLTSSPQASATTSTPPFTPTLQATASTPYP